MTFYLNEEDDEDFRPPDDELEAAEDREEYRDDRAVHVSRTALRAGRRGGPNGLS